MPNSKQLSTVVLMTKKEADKACQQINLEYTQAKVHGRKAGEAAYRCGLLLIDYREREGWKAQGYVNFTEGAMKEFAEFATSKSTVSRMLQHAEIVQLLGEVPSTEVTRAIAALPEPERKPVYEEAKEAANGKTPTAAQIRAVDREPAQLTACQLVNSPGESVKSAPKKAESPKVKTVPKYEKALERISAVCGKGVAKAIRDGSLQNVDEKGAVLWASLKDPDMILIQELVVTKRWKVKAAFSFMSKVPDDTTKIGALHNLTIAQGGASLVVIGVFATITVNIRKYGEEYSKIKKLLQLDK